MKKKLFLIATKDNKNFGLGDILRISSIIQNFKNYSYICYCDDLIGIMLKEIGVFHKVISINKLDIGKDKPNIIINCSTKISINKKFKYLNVNDFINQKNIGSKKDTFLLEKKIMNYFEIKNFSFFHYKRKTNFKKNKVFFGTEAPKIWSIKKLPKKIWFLLKNTIQAKYPLNIKFQKSNSNLKGLIKDIKSSEYVVTIVSLVAHLAIFFKKKTILLSGPTDFYGSNQFKNVHLIKPENKCVYRPCNLPNGINHCGCMDKINLSKIIKSFDQLYKNE